MAPNLWNTLPIFMVQEAEIIEEAEIIKEAEIIEEVQEYRLKYRQFWKTFKDHFFPTVEALKAKSVVEVFDLWKEVCQFCIYGYVGASVINAVVIPGSETDETTKPYYDLLLKNHSERRDANFSYLVSGLFSNIEEAICNEQKGNFELARLAYKKAQTQMREAAASSRKLVKEINQLCLKADLLLREIDANWEYKVLLQTGYKPNPPFQFNATADIPYTLMAKNYQEWDRLRVDVSKPKYFLNEMFKVFEDIVQLISAVNYISQLPIKIVQFPVKQNNQELAIQFSPWCILDEEKTKKFNFDKISTAMKEKLGLVGKETSAKTYIQSAEILDGASTKKCLYRFLYIPSEIEVSDYLEELD